MCIYIEVIFKNAFSSYLGDKVPYFFNLYYYPRISVIFRVKCDDAVDGYHGNLCCLFSFVFLLLCVQQYMHGLEKVNFSNNMVGHRSRVSMESSGSSEGDRSNAAVLIPNQSSDGLVDHYTEGVKVR